MCRTSARLEAAGFGANAAAAHHSRIGTTETGKGIPDVFLAIRLQTEFMVYHNRWFHVVGRAQQLQQQHEQQQAKHSAFRLRLKRGLHSLHSYNFTPSFTAPSCSSHSPTNSCNTHTHITKHNHSNSAPTACDSKRQFRKLLLFFFL